MDDDKDVVEQRKDKYRKKYPDTLTIQEMAIAMAGVRRVKDDLESQLKDVNAEFDVLRIEKIPSKMEAEGIENIRIEGIGRVSLTGDMWLHTVDQKGLFGWLRKQKLGDLIKETVSSSTLKAFVKDRIKAGKKTPPPEILKVEPYTRASITKA